MPDAHKNFAVSTVATAPSPASSGTSLVVAAGDGGRFPTPPFNAVICPANVLPTPANAEVVRVTAIGTDTLTITRAQESSSARSVVVGDLIFAGPTAKTLTDAEGNQQTLSLSAAASGTFTGLDGDTDQVFELVIVGTLAQGGTQRTVLLRPNGDSATANYEGASMASSFGAAVAVSSYATPAGIPVAFGDGTVDKTILVKAFMAAKTGRVRQATSIAHDANATFQSGVQQFAGLWENTATNITSLEVNFGGGTFTGSVHLRRGW